jgi:hypothetical protein
MINEADGSMDHTRKESGKEGDDQLIFQDRKSQIATIAISRDALLSNKSHCIDVGNLCMSLVQLCSSTGGIGE